MKEPTSIVECCDCMDFMAKFPDKYFELAIVDPPYGIREDGHRENQTRTKLAKAKKYHNALWDQSRPNRDYFMELKRISKNQIIWGANHFISLNPKDSSCWLVWNKKNGKSHFADAELAWTSFDTAVRVFEFIWQGMLQQNMKDKEIRIHPTQKPVALYKWILHNYAKEGDKILDTHMGSQSSRIAAYKMGFDYWGCEIDADYFRDGCKRFEIEKAQKMLF